MTNPFLKAEVDTAIQEIQDNIDELSQVKKQFALQSWVLAEYLHFLKDVQKQSVFRMEHYPVTTKPERSANPSINRPGFSHK